MVPLADANWLPGVTRKTNCKFELDYRWYRGITDDDASRPGDGPADVLDDFDDTFTQETRWEGGGVSSFTVDDCSVIATAWHGIQSQIQLRGSISPIL